jgi:hypothetical protein
MPSGRTNRGSAWDVRSRGARVVVVAVLEGHRDVDTYFNDDDA